jgi:hypothetical protein
LWSGGSTAIAYFVFPWLSLSAQLGIIVVVLVLGIAGYFASVYVDKHRLYQQH